MAKKYLRISEFANLISVSKTTVYKWLRESKDLPPYITVNGIVRFNREAALAWLEQHEKQQRTGTY